MKRCLLSLALVLVVQGSIHAEVKSKPIPYKHGDLELEGYYAWDDAVQGKRPGVLIVHEWWGLNDYARRRADQLAKLGYAAFAVDMYGKGKLTEHPAEAREWAAKGVRVNTITPGFFPAEQNRKLLFNDDGSPSARTKAIWGHTPMGRFGQSGELIGAAIFLASLKASSFVTGADIRVDGGFLAQTI